MAKKTTDKNYIFKTANGRATLSRTDKNHSASCEFPFIIRNDKGILVKASRKYVIDYLYALTEK